MADLRNPTGARLPYRQRHVHTEYIAFHISSMTMEVPVGGESTLLELFATEIYGIQVILSMCTRPLSGDRLPLDLRKFLRDVR